MDWLWVVLCAAVGMLFILAVILRLQKTWREEGERRRREMKRLT